MVQATVQQRTLNKISVLGADSASWPSEVRDLLAAAGGKVNRGGLVPKSFHLINGKYLF